MACKYCHKPKTKMTAFVQGQRYQHDGDDYICARVTEVTYALISMQSGNRWDNPTALAFVGKPEDFELIRRA